MPEIRSRSLWKSLTGGGDIGPDQWKMNRSSGAQSWCRRRADRQSRGPTRSAGDRPIWRSYGSSCFRKGWRGKKSPRARLIKIADKTSNLRSILGNPPTDWSTRRKREYFDWAAQVVARCRRVNAQLEKLFDRAYAGGMSTFTTDAA
jgi:hypothetical protein